MTRLLALLALLLTPVSTTAETASPAPPPALAVTLKDGFPDPDRIDWMRGLFPGATAEQKAVWAAVEAWEKTCLDAGTTQARAELMAMGATVGYGERQYPAPLCAAIMVLRPEPAMRGDWKGYLAANRKAKAAFDTLSYGAKLAFESAPFDPKWASADAMKLMRATVREQVYRKAMDWRMDGPAIDDDVWSVLQRRLGLAMTIEDFKNTAMLKEHVAKHGWPTISGVGERASDAAWLLAQHADHDPAFQLKALRLMEPLVARGEVSKPNYAYLFDRVMLKIAGKQRYATQMTCEGGKRVPQPLDGRGEVNARRASVDLNPVEDYIAGMNKQFGPCPAQ